MRTLVLTLCLVLLCCSLPLAAEPLKDYVPYEKDEFPLFTYKLRRAETLFLGSLVITLPVAMLVYSLAQKTNLIDPPASELQSLLVQGSIAASLSLGISVADFIIGEVGNT
ncbi:MULTISPECIES: hypothetical protein [Sphaerochaeta]|uniref:Uncharacterized protein n=2 Tax=root TaxID=1 RepID=A0ABY4DHZ7_9SPIR|nr:MULTISPECIES: hypothetical protein [Sphaerochaeta]NLA97491.1 hypothetical protein [Spirochaetales bacterium]MDD2395228.1 hypothetical protein [Sphaerochaeta sp.]MDD3423493.1 hypothetical protein [Sphaerochaeta sp.]MDD3455606.1 hypothetical protein [Sphaerochaeta sp.]MDD4037436.1 hypothetical protein [Sphaerochaeta sp.]